MKWFGFLAIAQDVIGFTVITSARNVGIIIGTATTTTTETTTGMNIGTTSGTIVATNNPGITHILRNAGLRAGVLFLGEKRRC